MRKIKYVLCIIIMLLLSVLLSGCEIFGAQKIKNICKNSAFTEYRSDDGKIVMRVIDNFGYKNSSFYGTVCYCESDKDPVLSEFRCYALGDLIFSNKIIKFSENNFDFRYSISKNEIIITGYHNMHSSSPHYHPRLLEIAQFPIVLKGQKIPYDDLRPYDRKANWIFEGYSTKISYGEVPNRFLIYYKDDQFIFEYEANDSFVIYNKQKNFETNSYENIIKASGTYTYDDPLDVTLHFEYNEVFDRDEIRMIGTLYEEK